MREEGVILKQHADISPTRWNPHDRLVIETYLAGAGLHQPGDHA
jgi:hypothetical protein